MTDKSTTKADESELPWYEPTPDQFQELWDGALISVDTCALLDLYRYPKLTQKKMLSAFKATTAKELLWLSFPTELEFHRNRPSVRAKAHRAPSELLNKLNQLLNQCRNEINNFKNDGHPDVSTADLEATLKETKEKLHGVLKIEKRTPATDTVADAVAELFGASTRQRRVIDDDFRRSASLRRNMEKPPGSKRDDSKPGDDRFADLVLWLDVLDEAKRRSLPSVILVTNDAGWYEEDRFHHSLVEEALFDHGIRAWAYRPNDFLHWVHEYYPDAPEASEETIDDVKRIDDTTSRLDRIEEAVAAARMAGTVLPPGFASQMADMAAMKTVLPTGFASQMADMATMKTVLPTGFASQVADMAKMQSVLPQNLAQQMAEMANMQQALGLDVTRTMSEMTKMQTMLGLDITNTVADMTKMQSVLGADFARSITDMTKMATLFPATGQIASTLAQHIGDPTEE